MSIYFSLLSNASLVIFHIRDLNANDLPAVRSPHQFFAFFLQESPSFSGSGLSSVPTDYFNVSLSYRLDSDVQVPYGRLKRIRKSSTREHVWSWEEVLNRTAHKKEAVTVFVSHCETPSKRETYYGELSKYITVNQYGDCSGRRIDQQSAEKAIADHYFYLAFENSVCQDYVTEKVFSRINQLIVPIVLKRSIINKFLPDNSFIAADDFHSPKELAEYLQYLMANRTEYERFFEWTKTYEKDCHVDSTCDICKFLHETVNKHRIVSDIRKWWYGGENDSICENGYAERLM
ncbi:unnamed protein product [Anisakis simplex]|uniref:Fucosyltransferase n=1 Tax=Anisakis simplex TaxID=6269 RepID=A0A0M3J034_ANISI|nr:unnamed protein product [Anisakis simplex]